ncbi:hypothetical protein HU200_035586 [Digitaria exilis]|uniref:Uncharacterized protein n=1 Tax=Digitaria exilis TaxID=1010633 RepID=A0A835BG83_9POAL|nr:hypothetical protein HU200_035586 [Digitaria exilis]
MTLFVTTVQELLRPRHIFILLYALGRKVCGVGWEFNQGQKHALTVASGR